MAAGHVSAAVKLDGRVKALSKSQSPFNPEVRQLRLQLQAECQAALVEEYPLAQVHRGTITCRDLVEHNFLA